MRKLSASLIIGAGAGLLDIAPMLAMRLPWQETASAFSHWLVLGVVVAYLEMDIPSWLKGVVAAMLTAIPILLLVGDQGIAATGPILGSSLVLGALVGWLTGRFAR